MLLRLEWEVCLGISSMVGSKKSSKGLGLRPTLRGSCLALKVEISAQDWSYAAWFAWTVLFSVKNICTPQLEAEYLGLMPNWLSATRLFYVS